jgi:hypothetical protein
MTEAVSITKVSANSTGLHGRTQLSSLTITSINKHMKINELVETCQADQAVHKKEFNFDGYCMCV